MVGLSHYDSSSKAACPPFLKEKTFALKQKQVAVRQLLSFWGYCTLMQNSLILNHLFYAQRENLLIKLQMNYVVLLVIFQISKLTLCGGVPFSIQRDSLIHAAHIIVATLGRLLDHLKKETVTLDDVKHWYWMKQTECWIWDFLMISMHYFSYANCVKHCSFLQLGRNEIAAISRKIQQNPVTIEIKLCWWTSCGWTAVLKSRHGKIGLLQKSFKSWATCFLVVFCNTKRGLPRYVWKHWQKANQSVPALHGDMEQKEGVTKHLFALLMWVVVY